MDEVGKVKLWRSVEVEMSLTMIALLGIYVLKLVMIFSPSAFAQEA